MLKATQRVAQLRARQLLGEMRTAARAKAELRRLEARRRFELGGAVLAAGGDWTAAEVVGIMLEARERVGHSPTMRMGLGRRGEDHLHAGQRHAANQP